MGARIDKRTDGHWPLGPPAGRTASGGTRKIRLTFNACPSYVIKLSEQLLRPTSGSPRRGRKNEMKRELDLN